MKRSTSLTLLTASLVLVALSHVKLESIDDNWLLVVDGRPVDVTGRVADQWNRLGRDCSGIERVPADHPFHTSALQAVRQHSPPDSASAQLRSLMRSRGWALAELQFSQLQDAVVLLHETPEGLSITPQGIWSGTTHPLHGGSFIRRYLRTQAPEAPADLIRCFDPVP